MKLLNLFKKESIMNKKSIINDLPISISSKIYSKEVLAIHHDFNSAAENLVIEAQSIINESLKKDISKISRLESLGFKQVAQVIELKPLQQKANLSKEQLESLAYYQREYPLNKFITEEQVKIICYNYNLVCGDVSRFKGFVPEKNLKDIEKFKIKDKDSLKRICSISTHTGRTMEIGDIVDDGGLNNRRYSSIYKLGEITESLKICAPVKDMDITGLELTEGYKLTKKHIPDPVVLQPVKNGYLILTAWGDEASDELVVNQINN